MLKVSAIALASPTMCCITPQAIPNRSINTYRNIILREAEFSHPVTILWGAGAENETQWNDIATWVIETFGLPGNCYVTDISTDHMTWFFRSSQDAVFMQLKFGSVTTNYDYA